MNALAVVLVAATFAVDYGWTARDDGGVEYIIQIEPELAEALRSGDLPEGVSSEIVPQVQNVRAFRIVIGEANLPREELPAEAGESRSESAKAPMPAENLLAADTSLDQRSRYGVNPRYAPPVAGPAAVENAVREAAHTAAQTVQDAANNASAQLQNEAGRVRQGLENSVTNGLQNAGNALRGTIEPSSTQPTLNSPAGPAGGPPFQGTEAANDRFQSNQYLSPAQFAQEQYDRSQQPAGAANSTNWPPRTNQFQNQGQQPPAHPNSNQQAPVHQGTHANQSSANWQATLDQSNWQGGNPAAAAPPQQPANQQQPYQNPPQPQQNYWNQPQQQQPAPPYQPPANQAPALYAPNSSPANQYMASNPALHQPANTAGGLAPPSLPSANTQPAANPQPTPVSHASTQHDHDHAAEKPQSHPEPANEPRNAPDSPGQNQKNVPATERGSESRTVAFVAMVLLLFSISGNFFLGYVASNFHKQTRKMAMQLRRARAH